MKQGNQNAAKPDSDKRTERVVLRVTAKEKAALEKKAGKFKNVSEYVRSFLFR